MRRAYLIKPRAALTARLESMGLADDMDFLARQTVFMTEPLPYEDKLERFRTLILTKFKEAFIKELCERSPLADAAHRETLFGTATAPADAFDQW